MSNKAKNKACGQRYRNPTTCTVTFEEENLVWVDTKAMALGGIGRSKVLNHLVERIRDLETKVPEAYRALMAAF